MLKEGSQIDRFIVEQEIGSGGMATVYRARHASLGTLHAIKILGADLAKDATLRRRFLAEGRIQARLSHPNIVRVTDTVEHGELAGLVMDLVEGETLTRFLRRFEGPPDAKTIREIFLQVLSAVGYAHQQGVIHRDLKPSNILVEDRSQGPLLARVLDFGIAKVMLEEADGAPLTSTGMVLGTPSYMSPEQVINARHVTPRSDIFSLGAVLYAFATRRRPFEGNTEYIVMRAIERCTFLPPEQVHPGIDKLIAQAITRAMLSEPSQRFASCEEFAAALAGKRKKAERRVPEPEPEPDPDVDIEERPTDLDVGRPPGLRRTTEVEAPACPEPEEKADFTPGAVAFEMEVEEAFDQEEVVAEEVVVKPKSLFKPAVTRQVERRKKVTRTRVVHRKAEVAFVTIEPGQFTMGSPAEEPGRSENEVEHEVIITRPFLLQATLVTQAQWTALMGKNPSGLKGVSRPVEMVTWYDALAYCNALSKKMKLDPAYVLSNVQGRPGEEGHVAKVKFKGLGSQGFRLPTEAEWEYACRAGQAGPRYGELDEICWWGGNSGNQTNPVAVKRPNGWGMYDMIGLCWEWCWDVMAPYPPGPLADPLGPESGKERVWRGGCWGSDQENCRAATRVGKLPTLRPFTTGFRVARTVSDTDV